MKKTKRKPNFRVKKTIENLIENHGNVSRAMVDAGYSKSYAKNPQDLVATQTFQDLMDELLPDKEIGKRLKEIMNAPRLVRKFIKGDLELETTETDPSQIKAVDIALKVKGRYPKESEVPSTSLVQLTNEQVQQLAELAADYAKHKRSAKAGS